MPESSEWVMLLREVCVRSGAVAGLAERCGVELRMDVAALECLVLELQAAEQELWRYVSDDVWCDKGGE